MQVIILFAFIASGCPFTVNSYNVKTGKFSVSGNTEVDQGQVQPAGSQSVKNLMACVHWFHMREDACFGDFDKMSKICNIFTSGCCDLNTKPKTGVYIFKRNLKGFSQQAHDCSYYKNQGDPSGVYTIYPDGVPNGLSVYCDMITDNGGWTVIQKRINGDVDFYRTWDEYKNGFGDVNGEYWLGNMYLNLMTYKGGYILRIDMEDTEGAFYGEYFTFNVAAENDDFRLTLGQFCGTAYAEGNYGMYNNNGCTFSTKDHNTAFNQFKENCTSIHHSGWWFKQESCTTVNVNGKWHPNGDHVNDIAYWMNRRTFGKGLLAITMMIRRK